MKSNSPCYEEGCKYYKKVKATKDGENVNRCKNPNRKIIRRGFKKEVIMGYADLTCKYFEKTNLKKFIDWLFK